MFEALAEFAKTNQGGQDRVTQQRPKEGPRARGQKVRGPLGHGARARCQPDGDG